MSIEQIAHVRSIEVSEKAWENIHTIAVLMGLTVSQLVNGLATSDPVVLVKLNNIMADIEKILQS